MANALLLGSSDICKFENFINRKNSENPYCLDDPRIDVHYYGISGGRIYNDKHRDRLQKAVSTIKPDRLILQIGGNDLDSANLSEDYSRKVVDKIVETCTFYVKDYGVEHVIICQFLPRFDTRQCDIDVYNDCVITANQYMKLTLHSESNIHYWKMKGLKDSENFKDGVHLSDLAQDKYYRCIRGALIHRF